MMTKIANVSQLAKYSLLLFLCFVLSGNVLADSLKKEADQAFITAYMAGNYEEATKIYRPRAILGDADAQRWLGLIYSEGKGVPQDYKEGVKWYRLAAEQGDADAQLELGSMYVDGSGVPQDYVLAHMWLNISAANEKNEGNAAISRNYLATKMSASQIAKAQELARKCIAQKLKGC